MLIPHLPGEGQCLASGYACEVPATHQVSAGQRILRPIPVARSQWRASRGDTDELEEDLELYELVPGLRRHSIQGSNAKNAYAKQQAACAPFS